MRIISTIIWDTITEKEIILCNVYILNTNKQEQFYSYYYFFNFTKYKDMFND